MTRHKTFWERVNKTDGCWLWTGGLHSAGYGQLSVNARLVYAHRHAYEQLVGPIPDGLVIDHLCRNRRCVNLEHLEPVTLAENTRRGAVPIGPHHTRCKRDHDLSLAENVTIRANGDKRCRLCAAEYERNRPFRPGRYQRSLELAAERRAHLETAEDREIRDGEDDA